MPPRRATSSNNVSSSTPPPGKTPRKRAASVDAVMSPKSDEPETVKVVVRMRPFNSKEKNEKRGPCIELDEKMRQVTITNTLTNPPSAPITFTYDSVHGEDTIQIEFYNTACRYLVDSVLKGFNGTIFAYGQTGCGKTWTMQGVLDVPELRGVIPNAFDHIFDHINSNPAQKFLVRGSYLEIYNEEVRDLIGKDSKAKLNLKEHPDKGVYVHGLLEDVVNDVEGINACMARGEKNRTVGTTLMNAGSSRSHSIFTCVIEEFGEKANGKDYLRAGKLNLVDLAGSETTSKTGATGQRMKEGVNINKSLSALGNVISALVDGKDKHIPYRDSKLTRLLQSSLGGNTKTLMMAAISPADYNYNETLSTLRYAARAKNIKNKAKVNEDPKDAMLREYMEEIKRLKEMLSSVGAVSEEDGTISLPSQTPVVMDRGGDDEQQTPYRSVLSASDLDENDRTPRLFYKVGSGAVLEVNPEMRAFLDGEGLGGYAEAFTVRGITTLEQLHQPWLANAEGFLMDKIGMNPLEVTHFQALMDPKLQERQSSPARPSRNADYSLNHLLDDDSDAEESMNLDNAFKFTQSGGDNSKSPRPICDPHEDDTVTYKDHTGHLVVGSVLERQENHVVVWDGDQKVSISLDDISKVVKAPPRSIKRTSVESDNSAQEELKRLKEENVKIMAEKLRIEAAENFRKQQEEKKKAAAKDGDEEEDNDDEPRQGQRSSFKTPTKGMTESEALAAQLAAAKEFIRQNEIEEKEAKQKVRAIRRGPSGRSSRRYSESEDEGEEESTKGRKVISRAGSGKGGKGVKPRPEDEDGAPRVPKLIGRINSTGTPRGKGEGVRARRSADAVNSDAEHDDDDNASVGSGRGKGGKVVKPRIRRPTDSVTSDAEHDDDDASVGSGRGKGGKGVKPRIRRPSTDSATGESARYEEDEEAVGAKSGKGVKPRIRRPSTDSVTKDEHGDDDASVGSGRGKGGKGVKPRIRRPSTDSVTKEDEGGVPNIGSSAGKGGKGGTRLRMESANSEMSQKPEDNRNLAEEGKKAEKALDSLWDTELGDNGEVGGVLPPPALIHESSCSVCGERLMRKTRKHCRACGHSVCELCSDFHLPLPKYGIVEPCRCCETCAHQIMAENERKEALKLKEQSKKNKMMRKLRDSNEQSEFFKEEEAKHAAAFASSSSHYNGSIREYNEDEYEVGSTKKLDVSSGGNTAPNKDTTFDIDMNADYVDEGEHHRSESSQYGKVENLKINLDMSASKLLQPNEPYKKDKSATARRGSRQSRASRNSAYSLRSSCDLSVDQGEDDFDYAGPDEEDGDRYDDEDDEEFDEDGFNQDVEGRKDAELLEEMDVIGAAMRKANLERRNEDFVKKALDESYAEVLKAEGGEKGPSQEVLNARAKFEARKAKVGARRANNKSDSCLKTHDEFGDKYRTSSSVLVDDFTGKVISFDEVLFGGMDPTDHTGVRSGGAVQKRIADLRGLLRKVDTLIANAGDMSEYKAKALIQQRETLEIELQEAMEDPEIADARASAAPAMATLPQPWERGVSLAVLDKFACEVVAPDSSTYDVVHSLRKSLAAVGRRTAFYGLFQDVGLKVVSTRPMRVVLEDGLEYDAEDGTMEEIEMVVPATGPPSVYICHNWAGSFEDSIMATMNWCMSCGLDPTQVFVWMDVVCLNQWTEVLGALGGVPEQAVVESFIFSIRACGNTLCVASPGFDTPDCLSRLWCAVEVYVSVCVGAQTSFGVPPREQEIFDDLIYSDLPEMFRRVVHGFDIAKAECTSQKDRVMLLKWVRNGHKLWGLPPSRDFNFVNRCVASALRAFLAQSAKRVAEERGVGIGGQIEGEEDSGIVLMTGYATLLEEQGRCGVGSGRGWCFKMSVVWWLKVLRMREFLDGKAAGTAEALLHVASLLKLQGRRDDAALRLSRVVVMLRDFLVGGGGCGQLGNCLVAAARCDIAIVYRDMGRFEDAISEYRQAQKDLMEPIDQDSLIFRDGETVKELRARYELMNTACNVLGLVPRGGDEGLMFEAVLGIASIRILQGQHDTALTIFTKALEMQEQALGSINESTVATKMCIGALKNRLMVPLHSGEGLSVEGFDRTLKVYEAVFGKTHPHTISVVLQFGALLQRLNESKAALRAYARALSEYAADEIMVQAEVEAQRMFMEDGSFGGVSNIEHEYISAKPPAEGKTLLIGDLYDEMSLHTARDTGGQYSPLDTAACVNNMAVEFRKLGMLGEASESFARALQIKERELGEFHPSTAKIMNNYALVRWRMGHLESSLEIFLRLLDLYDALDLTAERIATEEGPTDIEDFTHDGEKPKEILNAVNEIGQSVETERAKRKCGEMKFNRDVLARGVPPEDVALTLCHVALVYHQLGKPTESLNMFGRALAVREEVAFEAQVHTLNEGREGHRAGRAAADARAAQAAVGSTLYNRGLIYHQVNDLLNAGGDLRRAVLSSRLSCGPLHEYTSDAAGALAFVARALASLVIKFARKLLEEERRNARLDSDGNIIKDTHINDGDELTSTFGSQQTNQRSVSSSNVNNSFERAVYEAHKDECISCYECLGDHWRAVKGRGHPAAVAAFNSIAQVHKWEEKKELIAAAYTRAIREGNSRVDDLEDRLRLEANFTGDVERETPEQISAKAAAAEMTGRIASLREEKRAAEQRGDIKMEAAIKHEILQLQLRMIEQEEAGKVLVDGEDGAVRSSGRNFTVDRQDSSTLIDGGSLQLTPEETERREKERAQREADAKIAETWGSSQILVNEYKTDELVIDNWDTPEEDSAALRTRLECLKGLAVSMGELGRPEESAAYHARVLKLTQRAVQRGDWGKHTLVEPLVALAGSAFALGHFSQSRTLYEQALQVTEKESGPNSPDTAAALNDLAIVVRELHEDQEALQLHARAARIRQKTIGVWNATVAETLFNVALIYKDMKDLTSAIQVCRGCCRIFDTVLGADHADTHESEGLLADLNDDYKNKMNSVATKATNFFSCLAATPPKTAEEVPFELGDNPTLRLAFRTVLEEVFEGPQDGYYFHPNTDKSARNSRSSVGSFSSFQPSPFTAAALGAGSGGGSDDDTATLRSFDSRGTRRPSGSSVGSFSQPRHHTPTKSAGIAPLSEVLTQKDHEQNRAYTAGSAEVYNLRPNAPNRASGAHLPTATSGFERRDSFQSDGGGGGFQFEQN